MYEWIGKFTEADSKLAKLGGWIPASAGLLLCFLVSRLMYICAASFRRRLSSNMRELLGERSEAEIVRACKTYMYHLCVTIYEMVVDSPDRQLRAAHKQRFQTAGESVLENVLSEGKGAILYAPHMGNFFYYYWYLSRKYDCVTVATAGSVELRPLYLKFQQLGCSGLDYDATPPLELMRTLRKHLQRGGVVFLLGDFYRPAFPQAVLFNRLTRSPGGTAALALEGQVPVIPFYGCRLSGFRHRLVWGEPIYLHEKFARHEREQATNALNAIMQQQVTLHPEQWFYWFNADERWIAN